MEPFPLDHQPPSTIVSTNNVDDGDEHRALLMPTDEEAGHQTVMITASALTLSEKLDLISGASLWTTHNIDRLTLPSLTLADGPHGLRVPLHELGLHESHPATCFPTACCLSGSWDIHLVQRVGVALSQQCQAQQVHILLGPGLNLKRHPCGGRNFEYYSEDPVLSSRLASACVNGVQLSGKVAACIKHYVVNNQESHRFVVNAVVDERTLNELYLSQFQYVVQQSQPATLMCAYNRVNGVYCSEHSKLLMNVLRHDWKYKGVAMTDWGATNNRVRSLLAGMDLEMPGSHGAHHWELRQALEEGRLDEAALDESVQRLLNLIQKYGGNSASTNNNGNRDDFGVTAKLLQEHHQVAYQAALESIILLKNDKGCLPLCRPLRSMAVIGDFASEHPRYQGMGSSRVSTPNVVSALSHLSNYCSDIRFASGYHADDDHLYDRQNELIQEALEAAKDTDVVLLFCGLPEIMESEGFDRTHMKLPAQHTALIEELCHVHKNVVVILCNGGAVEMPWYHLPNAIWECYLAGEGGGEAVVDLIFGKASPCGKLAESFPERMEDVLADDWFPGSRDIVQHREGLLVGYRYLDTVQKPVRYPFGHGLSYTNFTYSGLAVSVEVDEPTSKAVRVSFALKNSGNMAAKEIVQCYIHRNKSSRVFRAEQELKDFTKISLNVDESTTVSFTLTESAFSFYDIGSTGFNVEPGEYEVRIASSSRDIRLRQIVTFQTGVEASETACVSYPPAPKDTVDHVDDITFATRFGDRRTAVLTELVDPVESDPDGFHRNSLIKEVAASRILGKILYYIVYKEACKEVQAGPTEKRQKRMVRAAVRNLPLRVLVLFSRGGISFDTLDAMIALMNFRPFTAIRRSATALYHFLKRSTRRVD